MRRLRSSVSSWSPRSLGGDESYDEVRRLRKEAERSADQSRLGEALKTYEKLFAAIGYVHLWDACNAGRIAYRMERMRDAYEHLSQCDQLGRKAEPRTLDAQGKRILSESRSELALARARVARVWVFVSKPNADVMVDDRKIGSSPVLRELVLEPGDHRITATLGAETASARVNVPAGEMQRVDLDLIAPPASRAPAPSPAPTESAKPALSPAPTADTEPGTGSAASVANGRPVRQSRTWPRVLALAAGGVSLVGVAIAAGGYVATVDAVDDANASFHTANVYGCYGATAECNKYDRAQSAIDKAAYVVDVSLGITGVLAGALLTAAVWGDVTTPVEIEAAPAVGGIVLRGTF